MPPPLFWFPSGSLPISPPNQPSRPSPLFSAKGQPYPPLDPLEPATDPLLLDFSYQPTYAFFCLLSSQGRGHSLGARAPLPEPQPPRSVQPRRRLGPLLLLCFLLPPLPISSSLTHLPLSQVRHEQRHGWAPPADAKSPPWPPFVLVAAFRIPAGSASSVSPSCRSPSTSTTHRTMEPHRPGSGR